jgi:uncharacterized repeat protein (TIGR01451 family)
VTDAPDPVDSGNAVTWTVAVHNNGPSDAPNVSVAVVMPAGVGAPTVSGGCTSLPCNLGTIAAGSQKTFDVQATVAPATAGILVFTATAGSSGTEMAPGDEQATAPTQAGNQADVYVEIKGPATAAVGATSSTSSSSTTKVRSTRTTFSCSTRCRRDSRTSRRPAASTIRTACRRATWVWSGSARRRA